LIDAPSSVVEETSPFITLESAGINLLKILAFLKYSFLEIGLLIEQFTGKYEFYQYYVELEATMIDNIEKKYL